MRAALPFLLAAIAAAEPLSVMSFNVRYPASGDGPDVWPDRKDRLVRMLRQRQPDLIGTQELFYEQGQYIVEQIPEYEWFGVSRRGNRDDEHMAVFYKRARLRLVDAGSFWLSDSPDKPGSMSWGVTLPRMVTWGLFEPRAGGERFYFFNTHFAHRREDTEARTASAKLIAGRIAKIASGHPVILTGDFNASPDSDAYSALVPALTDAWKATPARSGPEGTFHGFTGKPGAARIDWILFRGPIGVTRVDVVLDHESGRYPSDHFPVMARLSMPPALREVEIRSPADASTQKAMWLPPRPGSAAPLVIALHSWSGDYKQRDALEYARRCEERGWAMIFPDFRGPNNRPIAGGSDAAVSDVAGALEWAKRNASIDASRVYLVGGSGGGYMSLLMLARHPALWHSVSAWVPITDLAAWHADSKSAGRKYAGDLEAIFGGPPDAGREAEYKRRSPLGSLGGARGVRVEISAGIHDGHTGSVPVYHALRAFNELARTNGAAGAAVAGGAIDEIVRTRKPPAGEPVAAPDPAYSKPVLFRREAGPARVTLFDGGHEVLYGAMFAWLDAAR